MPKFPKEKLIDTQQHYAIPYNKVPLKPPIKEIKIFIYWRDGFSEVHKGFDNIHHFAAFLKDNPELAAAIGYIPKNEK